MAETPEEIVHQCLEDEEWLNEVNNFFSLKLSQLSLSLSLNTLYSFTHSFSFCYRSCSKNYSQSWELQMIGVLVEKEGGQCRGIARVFEK